MNIINHFSLKYSLLFLVIGILSLTACVKEQISTTTIAIGPETQQLAVTSIYGRILDNNDTPIIGALVAFHLDDEIKTIDTDELGYFFFQDVLYKGKSAFISVQSSGKFEAFRRMSVLPNRFNYTEIKMNTKSSIGQLSAIEGGTLNHNSGAKITLPANGIVNTIGNAYTGNVDVKMAWIDPSTADLSQRMIGDLSGIDTDGNLRSLGTFGMLQVELLDEVGNELTLAEGTEATLVFPVPTSMQENAPSTIPLWSFDESQGIWVQEGEAIYTDGEYIGMVSHFSSWNVDCLNDPIEISGEVWWQLENDSTYASSYLQVWVCGEKFGQKGGWLCDDGEFLFYNFPKNEVFELKIKDRCGETLYQESYGPFLENTDIGTIIIDTDYDAIAINGNAIDCEDNAVTDGFVNVNLMEQSFVFPLDENGYFKFSVDVCEGASGELSVINQAAQFTSNPIFFNASESTLAFENISVCDELEDFLTVRIDNGDIALYSPGIQYYELIDSLNNEPVEFIKYSTEDNEKFVAYGLAFRPSEISSLEVNAFAFNYTLQYWGEEITYYDLGLNNNIQITFSEYDPNPGGKVAGTYLGNVIVSNPNTPTGVVPISGEFSIPID